MFFPFQIFPIAIGNKIICGISFWFLAACNSSSAPWLCISKLCASYSSSHCSQYGPVYTPSLKPSLLFLLSVITSLWLLGCSRGCSFTCTADSRYCPHYQSKRDSISRRNYIQAFPQKENGSDDCPDKHIPQTWKKQTPWGAQVQPKGNQYQIFSRLTAVAKLHVKRSYAPEVPASTVF